MNMITVRDQKKKKELANKGESNDKEELTDKEESEDLPLMLPDEEVKEGRRFKILTQTKLLTRLAILLAQIKDGNNSYKLNNNIRQILYVLY